MKSWLFVLSTYGIPIIWPSPFASSLLLETLSGFSHAQSALTWVSSSESSWQCQNLPFLPTSAFNPELTRYAHLQIGFLDLNKLFSTNIWRNFYKPHMKINCISLYSQHIHTSLLFSYSKYIQGRICIYCIWVRLQK